MFHQRHRSYLRSASLFLSIFLKVVGVQGSVGTQSTSSVVLTADDPEKENSLKNIILDSEEASQYHLSQTHVRHNRRMSAASNKLNFHLSWEQIYSRKVEELDKAQPFNHEKKKKKRKKQKNVATRPTDVNEGMNDKQDNDEKKNDDVSDGEGSTTYKTSTGAEIKDGGKQNQIQSGNEGGGMEKVEQTKTNETNLIVGKSETNLIVGKSIENEDDLDESIEDNNSLSKYDSKVEAEVRKKGTGDLGTAKGIKNKENSKLENNSQEGNENNLRKNNGNKDTGGGIDKAELSATVPPTDYKYDYKDSDSTKPPTLSANEENTGVKTVVEIHTSENEIHDVSVKTESVQSLIEKKNNGDVKGMDEDADSNEMLSYLLDPEALDSNTNEENTNSTDSFTNEEKKKMEIQELQDEKRAARKIGGWAILLCLAMMMLTAYQMSENPDGVFANICRLAMTVTGCIFKILLYPCKKLFGNRFTGYEHHLVTTQDFRDSSWA